MSKSIKNCFYERLTFSKLVQAHERAKKNKTNRYELLRFEVDFESNIISIMDSLCNGSYNLGKYREFTIYEPKERIIRCLPYRDRIVQQWYIYEFIKPYIIPRLISSTCACIDNRGTHYAVKLVQRYMRIMKRKYNNYYILKLDIKKYFYNIDKDILYDIMKGYISDRKLLWLTKIFIYDGSSKLGIPIGNYTSQYFANIYLSVIDRYIKEELGIRYYVRYMDDMVILLKDKEECMDVFSKIRNELESKLCLELNKKSRYYPNNTGIMFCGYKIYETHILVKKDSKYKMKKKIRKWKMDDKIDSKAKKMCFNSWLSHVGHANSYNLVNSIINSL